MNALAGVFQRSINGNGSIVGLVGPPGIGKSRVVRELTAQATGVGVEVAATYCESHTTDLPFHAAAGLLRSTAGLEGLDDAAARERVRARFADADEDDVVLLCDLLGIGDPASALPQIDPDARRRRITAMVKATALARRAPIVYVVEDAHWIDGISESMLAEFLDVIPQTPSLVLITYRPEYTGALAHSPRSQTIALEPLDESQMLELSAELLGEDGSVAELAELITSRAAGNPFFAEEIVRDLSERDVLIGGRGCYLCIDLVADVHVPRTLQAVIAARIDRLDPSAKRALNAAAVIGSRFTPDMLVALEVDANLGALVAAELIDQTEVGPEPEYAFRHPLIRAVAYESQLKSDRAQLHRRVATVISQEDQNAALIADHMEAAGDLPAAYEWHMRAAAWSAKRDTTAAQLSWQRALEVADALPADAPNRLAMRIAPRTLICGNSWKRFHPDISARFTELKDLCAQADDKASLTVGMAGMTMEHVFRGHVRDGSRLASEYMAMVESIGDPALTIALSFAAIVAKHETGETAEALRWTQAVIDLAVDDHDEVSIVYGSPRATALAWRGTARFRKGVPGWREDFDHAIELAAARSDHLSHAAIITYKYAGIPRGLYVASDSVLREIESAMKLVERSSDDIGVVFLGLTLAMAQIHHGADPKRGYDGMRTMRETCIKEDCALNMLALIDSYLVLEQANLGEVDEAVRQWRAIAEDMESAGRLSNNDLPLMFATEQLLLRGDHAEAAREIERLESLAADRQWVSREICALRLRVLLARARGDDSAYRELRDRYRAMANELGYEGHMKWCAELP
jgi:hypothetical protein